MVFSVKLVGIPSRKYAERENGNFLYKYACPQFSLQSVRYVRNVAAHLQIAVPRKTLIKRNDEPFEFDCMPRTCSR